MKVEYRVVPIHRYIVTRYCEEERAAGSSTRGEYDNADVAFEVAYALCKAEHERLGYPPGDERIQYPSRPMKPGEVIYVATGAEDHQPVTLTSSMLGQ